MQQTVKIEGDRNARIDKIIKLSKGNGKLDNSKKYPVIYADPPWRFNQHLIRDLRSVSRSFSRTAENHYPTISLQEICDLPVEKIAT